MIQRTTNPGCHQYARYGARGVSVCDRWRVSFSTFLADMGPRPGPGFSLDRYPDQAGNYEPGNVRWADRTDQNRNRRNVRVVTLDSITRTLPEWIALFGIPASTVHSRLRLGWSPERALTTPPRDDGDPVPVTNEPVRACPGKPADGSNQQGDNPMPKPNRTTVPPIVPPPIAERLPLQPAVVRGNSQHPTTPKQLTAPANGAKPSSSPTRNVGANGKPRNILEEALRAAGMSDREMEDLARSIAADTSLPRGCRPSYQPEPAEEGLRPALIEQDARTEDSSPSLGRRGRRDRRVFQGWPGPVGDTARFLADYVALPDVSVVVVATWVVAAWLADKWDKFPHLAATSPEKRCGKTTLLDVLATIVPRPRYTTNISPAALYRVIEAEKPTLLMDESQSISRRGSEASEVIREILNAGIGQNAKVTRCGGEKFEQIQEFSVYSPKVFALIGNLDGVLADRCLPVELRRKTKSDEVQRFRSRVVGPRGKGLYGLLEKWAKSNGKTVATVYDRLTPFDIENDRMAELLLPLQAMLTVACKDALGTLEEYAQSLDSRDKEQEMQSPGVRLLVACRELFAPSRSYPAGFLFIPTELLIARLVNRGEEPWHRWCRGQPITGEALANLLRPYGIKPGRNKQQTARGYHAADFREAWDCYLPSPSKNPSTPSTPAIERRTGR
jgi:putative DNA primase/helicase